MRSKGSEQYVLIRIDKELFGLPSDRVKEMVALPPVTKPPRVPEHVRGLINLRGKIMPVLDLRLLLGFPSRLQEHKEICEMITQGEQDHRRLIEDLEASVREGREFTLATDSRQCKFGKWYYAYQTEDPFFRSFLNRFRRPHEQIHAIAIKVKQHLTNGDSDTATRLIGTARSTTFQEMMRLFAQFPEEYARTHSEIVVILEVEGGDLGVSVDSAASTEPMELCGAGEMASLKRFKNDLAVSIGRLRRSNEIVVLLDVSRFDGVGALHSQLLG